MTLSIFDFIVNSIGTIAAGYVAVWAYRTKNNSALNLKRSELLSFTAKIMELDLELHETNGLIEAAVDHRSPSDRDSAKHLQDEYVRYSSELWTIFDELKSLKHTKLDELTEIEGNLIKIEIGLKWYRDETTHLRENSQK